MHAIRAGPIIASPFDLLRPPYPFTLYPFPRSQQARIEEVQVSLVLPLFALV